MLADDQSAVADAILDTVDAFLDTHEAFMSDDGLELACARDGARLIVTVDDCRYAVAVERVL